MERCHKDSKPFANGENPFDLIFLHRGLGRCHLTSNSLNNDSWIRKQEKEKSAS